MDIYEQPPQVIKTGTKFSSSIRFLLPDLINSRIDIEVSILNEPQARILMETCDNSFFCILNSGVILHRKLELRPTTKQPVANFRNLIVQSIKRSQKSHHETVTDEKFVILFQAKITLQSGFVYIVKTLSLPIVVIVHCNQEAAAWATVTWDNAFSSKNRVPFAVPNEVPWAKVKHILSTKFSEFVGGELISEDLNFLAGKAFRDFNCSAYNQMNLSWFQFGKELLPGCNFTFWEWFYAILKLSRDHLRDLWKPNKRLIHGFIGRRQTEDSLTSKPVGTFLLRYSETSLGCISIAFKAVDGTIQHIAPSNSKELKDRSLSDRIKDLGFNYLYPNIPKDQAFGEFYTNQNFAPASYITTELAALQ